MEPDILPTDDYAGFWARFAAYFIDLAVISFLVLQVYWLFDASLVDASYLSNHSDGWERNRKLLYYVLVIVNFFMAWLYYAGFESSPLRATPGKWLLGIYVTDVDGNRIGFGKASGRFFGKMLSGLIIGIGYMMAGFTQHSQALHDQMADCLVWRK
jgi:uncharacterized RDD family membrane protein YckC